MTSSAELEVDADGIATLTWGRADVPRLPADAAVDSLAGAVQRVATDASIVGAVITGEGTTFGFGLNFEALLTITSGATAASVLREAVDRLNDTLRAIESSAKPFVAALAGHALGVDFEIALACRDRVMATGDAVVGLVDAKLGLPPMAGGALRLARLVGVQKARAMLVRAQSLSPTQALRARLVDELVTPGELMRAAKRRVERSQAARREVGFDAFTAPDPDPRQPARAAIDATLAELSTVPYDAALDAAAARFVDVARGPVARSMVRTLGIGVARANALARRPAGFPRQVFRRVGVLGAGLMGSGIAWVCARAGMHVTLVDVSDAAAERGLSRLRDQEKAAVAAGRSDADASRAAFARIAATGRYEALRDVDIVVEAVFEDREVKAEATRRAEAAMDAQALFATNTSTLPIGGLAAASVRPDRFIGLHFFSPVPRMPLLEIIRGAQTSDRTLAAAMDFAQQIGKTPIVVKDARGFYTTRVVMAYQAEAFDMLAQGVPAERVEAGGVATGMPIPPLALSDAVALDLIHQINVQTRIDLGGAYRQSPGYELVGRMVERLGRTGKKSGKGFYDYDGAGRKLLWPGLAEAVGGATIEASVEDVRDRLLAAQALETVRALDEGVTADPSEADVGAILGWGFAPWTGGPLSYIDGQGVAAFVARCDDLADRYRSERIRPTSSLRKIAARSGTVYDLNGSL